MDFNHPKRPNTSWELLDMAMEDHIGLNDLCPNYSLQTHEISSSTQMPNSSFFGTQTRNHQIEEEEEEEEEEPEEELGAMKEMMYRIAAMQPVDIDPATIRKPKRRNVRISDDPQSVAARLRRERISERMRILQRLVPGGTKMDTSSMLDEAIRYVKFLKRQIRELQSNPQLPSIEVTRHDTSNLAVESHEKALGSTVSSSAEPPVGPVYAFGGSEANDHPMYFN